MQPPLKIVKLYNIKLFYNINSCLSLLCDQIMAQSYHDDQHWFSQTLML